MYVANLLSIYRYTCIMAYKIYKILALINAMFLNNLNKHSWYKTR